MLKEERFWTFEAVQERLVEAMVLWMRSPGGGKWPFAGDGPWALITRRTRMAEGVIKGMDIARLLQEDDAAETSQWQGRERPRPLTRAEVAIRDETSEWLRHVAERDRQLVVLALRSLARGDKKVRWLELWKAFGRGAPGPEGLQTRYRRAIGRIAKALNG